MADFNALPPEDRLPEEAAAPAPGVCPPPEEGAAGNTAEDRRERARSRKAARQRSKSVLLLAVAGAALCTVISAAPVNPADLAPSAETAATDAITQTEPTQPPLAQPAPAETEPAALTAAQRLVAVGTWKNDAAREWVHFNDDGSGWWYDGTYFGLMSWEEGADGECNYKASMSYLSPERQEIDDWAPTKAGDSLHSVNEGGSIELPAEEDRFTCPGLRFGDGTYLPDDTAIDASVMDGVCGKTAAELVSGTSWHMVETSDLGIPFAPSADGGKDALYTDQIYVQSIDFASGTFVIATRDGGLLEEDYYAADGSFHAAEPARTLGISFSLSAKEEKTAAALIRLELDAMYSYFSDYHPGDTEYNNMHLLWGRSYHSADAYEFVYLLLTESGIRLGMDTVDLYESNYTLLASD